MDVGGSNEEGISAADAWQAAEAAFRRERLLEVREQRVRTGRSVRLARHAVVATGLFACLLLFLGLWSRTPAIGLLAMSSSASLVGLALGASCKLAAQRR